MKSSVNKNNEQNKRKKELKQQILKAVEKICIDKDIDIKKYYNKDSDNEIVMISYSEIAKRILGGSDDSILLNEKKLIRDIKNVLGVSNPYQDDEIVLGNIDRIIANYIQPVFDKQINNSTKDFNKKHTLSEMIEKLDDSKFHIKEDVNLSKRNFVTYEDLEIKKKKNDDFPLSYDIFADNVIAQNKFLRENFQVSDIARRIRNLLSSTITESNKDKPFDVALIDKLKTKKHIPDDQEFAKKFNYNTSKMHADKAYWNEIHSQVSRSSDGISLHALLFLLDVNNPDDIDTIHQEDIDTIYQEHIKKITKKTDRPTEKNGKTNVVKYNQTEKSPNNDYYTQTRILLYDIIHNNTRSELIQELLKKPERNIIEKKISKAREIILDTNSNEKKKAKKIAYIFYNENSDKDNIKKEITSDLKGFFREDINRLQYALKRDDKKNTSENEYSNYYARVLKDIIRSKEGSTERPKESRKKSREERSKDRRKERRESSKERRKKKP